MDEIKKYFIFSDESGSWHDTNDVYVRAWIVVSEDSHSKLVDAINYISTDLNTKELSWKSLANNEKYWNFLEKFNFRIFLTVTCPTDIKWETKYNLTKTFKDKIDHFDFGMIDDELKLILKKKMFDDIKNVLFLHYYEKAHIESAKNAIQSILAYKNNQLIYRVDPPQMSKDGWKNILERIVPTAELEFPNSQKSEGVQFADIIAGSIRSFMIEDKNFSRAKLFISKLRPKLIPKNTKFPNPNIVFYSETSQETIAKLAQVWVC